MPTSTSNPIDALTFIRNGDRTARWNFPDAVGTPFAMPGGTGNAVALSFGFASVLPAYAQGEVTGFRTFNVTEANAARQVLTEVASLTWLTFTELGNGDAAQLRFASVSLPAGVAGVAFNPSYGVSTSGLGVILSVAGGDASGDVALNADIVPESGYFDPGGFGYVTLLHEVGHALGLKHPFEAPADGFLLDASLDNTGNTVMAYNAAPNSTLLEVTGNSGSFSVRYFALQPDTMQMLDIEALQFLYGANTTTRTGNDIYSWALNPEMRRVIWDAGGTDTLDCSNQLLTCEIDLRAGTYSSISLRRTDAEKRLGLELPAFMTLPLPSDVYDGSRNLGIARGATIENALGGSGNDRLTGNEVANLLDGGDGADVIAGLAGDDTLRGGMGDDTLDLAGGGNDTAEGGEGSDAIMVSGAGTLGALDRIDGGAGTDTLFLNGSTSLTFSATTLVNTEVVRIGAGANYALRTAAETVSTGQQMMVIATALEATRALFFDGAASAGSFTFIAGPGNDTLAGGTGNDSFDAVLGGRDSFYGGPGNDTFTMRGTLDALDVIHGGTGVDTVDLSSLNGGAAYSLGGAGFVAIERLSLRDGANYHLVPVEALGTSLLEPFTVLGQNLSASHSVRIDGGAITGFAFKAHGGAGNDQFSLGARSDFIDLQRGGNDTVDAGAGNDTISFTASFDAMDSVQGGDGTADTLVLTGAYGAAALGLANVSGVEFLRLTGGSFWLAPVDAFTPAGMQSVISATTLAANQALRFDGQLELDGRFDVQSGAAADQLTGGAGDDRLFGGGGDDTISSGGGADLIVGGAGADVLMGGAGADRIVGDAGLDRFVFLSASDSTVAASDELFGIFTGPESDVIDLRAIDAIAGTPGDDAFTFVAGSFTGVAGQLRISGSAILADTNGDTVADIRIIAAGAGSDDLWL